MGCGLWAVGCGLWVVGCGLWVVGQKKVVCFSDTDFVLTLTLSMLG